MGDFKIPHLVESIFFKCLSKSPKTTRLNVAIEIKHQSIMIPFIINGNIVQPVQ